MHTSTHTLAAILLDPFAHIMIVVAAVIVVAIADVTIAIVTVVEIGAMIVIDDRTIAEVRVGTIAIIAETIVTAAVAAAEAAAVVIGRRVTIAIDAMAPERRRPLAVFPCRNSTQVVLRHWSLPICFHSFCRQRSKWHSSSKHNHNRSKTGLWRRRLASR